MWEKVSKILKGPMVTAVVYIIFGACLVCMPADMINVICRFVFGILLIAVGLYHILIYVAEQLKATVFDLFSGGVLLVVGIFLFTNTPTVVRLLPVLLGTFILVDSLWKLKGCVRLKKRNRSSWKVLLAGCLIFIGLGIALMANPFSKPKDMAIFAGCIFLADGIIDLISLFLIRRGTKGEITTKEKAIEEIPEDDIEEEQPEEPAAPEPEYTPWSERQEVWKEEQKTEETSEETQETDEEQNTASDEKN